MNNNSNSHLTFVLQVEDDWPPVSSEGIPCKVSPEGYEVEKAPLFIKEISAGDIIKITEGSEEQVIAWDYVRKSNRSTVWLLRLKETSEIDPALAYIRTLGCDTVSLPELGSYSINIPGECDMSLIDDCLDKLNKEHVAVAYPSFRH